MEKEVLSLLSNEKYHINADLHLSGEVNTEPKRLEDDLHVPGIEVEDEHGLEDELHLTGKDVAEDHRMKDDLHVLEKEVSKEHGMEDDLHVPGKEVSNEQPIEDDLHKPIKESAGEHRVEDGSHVIGKGVEEEHQLEDDLHLTGEDVAEDHRMKDDLNVLEKQVPKEHDEREDLHLIGKDVAEDHRMKGYLYVPIKESAGEHMVEDGSHVPVKDFAGEHPVEDYLHVLGERVAKEHRVKDDLNVPGKGDAREHPVEDDLHVLGIRVATEHRVEDDLHITGKEVSGEHRMEGDLHVPRKDVARENRLKDKKHVPGKEVEQKNLMKDSLHVPGKELAGGHRLENDSNAPGKIVAEEHHTKDEVWDRCFEQGKLYIRTLLRRGLFPPADILDELCDCYGRKSRIVNDLCSFAKQKIKKEIESTFHTKVVDIYPSFKDGAENTIVFVVTLNKRVSEAEIREMITYAVEIKYLNAYNKEPTLLAQHILKEQIYMTKDELQNVQSCQENMEEELFAKHYYLSMITSAPVKSYQYSECDQHINVERKVCLQLYIHAKGFIPIWEDPFEKQYRGIDTDIIECVFISFGRTAREPHDNIKMGCLIQRENIPPGSTDIIHPPIKGGTLGGFIEHPELGLCGITCAHAMIYKREFEKCVEHNNKLSLQDWPEDLKQKTAVYQPDQTSLDIGVLSEAYYDTGSPSRPGFDIALIKIRNRHPINGKFPVVEQQGIRREVGKVFESGAKVDYTTLAIDRHIEVWKFGSATDSTSAFISSGPVTAREIRFGWQNDGTFEIKLHKQIQVTSLDPQVPFALRGDSGALVFHEQPPDRQLVCIGMVEGGFDGNPELTVVAPIMPVLDRLNVQSIYTFSDTKLYEMEARLERNFTQAMTANQAVLFEILQSNTAEIMHEIRNLQQVPMDED
ncbi:uncharacterized protein LOC128220751 isoform X2 [Mya arenaria]|uniref:uncharacterized protein LOC128220751 isoform X2 n=1 Tax=Mya arenaria TaxID=6604 RepID=UPI0022E64AE1|nr:uncharacterized protein LOC128220751 isoform X2 [Mya arenaria]